MTVKVYLLLVAASIAVFLLFPGLDVWVSGWFYQPGAGFAAGGARVFTLLHDGVPYLLAAVMLAATGLFAANLIRGTNHLQLRLRGMVFVLLALALGPGVLANVVLKDNWGRARPSHLVEFGGQSRFTPPLVVSDQCDHNCSFVAGDASAGFFLLAFALLARRHRGLAIAGALAVGIGLGMVRVIQGGHFLSDVLFAGWFVGGLVWLLHGLIMSPDGWPRSQRALGRLGAALEIRTRTAAGRLELVALASLLLAGLSMLFADRAMASWVEHLDPAVRALFGRISVIGLSTGYLIGSALAALACLAVARLSLTLDQEQRWRSYAMVPLFLFCSIAAAGLTADLIKSLVGRFRPKLFFRDGAYGFDFLHFQADYLSFPSGHAATAFALATALTLLWPRHVAAYVLLALLVGASRVLSNAHWLSDVVGGALIGILMALYVARVFRANGVNPRAALAGAAVWRSAPTWTERLALEPWREGIDRWRDRAKAGAASCLAARRPLPLMPANTDDAPHGQHKA